MQAERRLFGLTDDSSPAATKPAAAAAPPSKKLGGMSLATYFFKVPQACKSKSNLPSLLVMDGLILSRLLVIPWADLPVLGHTAIVTIDYGTMQWSP